jgi:hypothetical protein
MIGWDAAHRLCETRGIQDAVSSSPLTDQAPRLCRDGRKAERDCSPDDRPFNALAEFRCGVNTRINRHLDLVTEIFTRPEMTDAAARRPR